MKEFNKCKIKDLDFKNDLIYIRVTKNRETLVLSMGKTLKKVLLEYLRYRSGEDNDYLFCNLRGNNLQKMP